MTEISITTLIIIVDRDALCDHKEIFIHVVLIMCEGVAICLVQCSPKLCCDFC